MKTYLLLFTVFFSSVFAFQNLEDLFHREKQIYQDHRVHESKTQHLYNLYTFATDHFDSEKLRKHPELTLGKVLTKLNLLEDVFDIEQRKQTLIFLLSDLEFVLKNTCKSSFLHRSAQFHKSRIIEILKRDPQDFGIFMEVNNHFMENVLRKWATHPWLSGQLLRDDVKETIKKSSKKFESFLEFVRYSHNNLNVVTGKFPIESVIFLETSEDFTYQIEYIGFNEEVLSEKISF